MSTPEVHPQTAFVYPGQGGLAPGKIARVLDRFAVCREHFVFATDYASERLHINLGKIMLEGGTVVLDGETVDINDTRIAQPATFIESTVGSIGLVELLERKPAIRSYHSMGLLAALHDREIIDTESALELVLERGESMHQAFIERPGAMAAFFNVAEERLMALCKKWGITIANENSHTEMIVSGDEEGVDSAIEEQNEEVEKNGGKKPIRLVVPGAAHSDIVKSAGAAMGRKVDAIKDRFQIPEGLPEGIAVFSSRTLRFLRSFEDVKADVAGLPDRVYWKSTILQLADDGFTDIFETGPGSKLSRLPRKDSIMAEHLKARGAFIMSLDQLLDKETR